MPSKNNLHRVKSISEDKEPILSPEKTKAFKKIIKPKVERVNKGFQVVIHRTYCLRTYLWLRNYTINTY